LAREQEILKILEDLE